MILSCYPTQVLQLEVEGQLDVVEANGVLVVETLPLQHGAELPAVAHLRVAVGVVLHRLDHREQVLQSGVDLGLFAHFPQLRSVVELVELEDALAAAFPLARLEAHVDLHQPPALLGYVLEPLVVQEVLGRGVALHYIY